jgi:hypothetical protein
VRYSFDSTIILYIIAAWRNSSTVSGRFLSRKQRQHQQEDTITQQSHPYDDLFLLVQSANIPFQAAVVCVARDNKTMSIHQR